jgi:hypothetical protein
VFDHTLLPLKLTGLGIMLLGVGRTFGVIVGFVKARTTIIKEFIDSIVAINFAQRRKALTQDSSQTLVSQTQISGER